MLRYFVKIACLVPFGLFGQEIVLNSPQWIARSVMNPTNISLAKDFRFSALLTTKKLWDGIQGSPRIYGVAIDAKPDELNGIGFHAWNHDYAALRYTTVSLPYVRVVKLSPHDGFLLGLTTTFTSSTLDVSDFTHLERLDVVAADQSSIFLNAIFGASYYFKDELRVGGFIGNFLTNASMEGRNIINYSSYASRFYGLDFTTTINNDFIQGYTIILDGTVRMNDYTGPIANLSVRIGQERVLIGAGYRTNGEINYIAHFGVNTRGELGYVYTYSLNELQQYSNGSHQVFYRYNLWNRQ